MSEIRRWDIQLSIEPEDGEVRAHITEAPDGYLVLHSDYTTERTAREAAEAAVARMEGEHRELLQKLQELTQPPVKGMVRNLREGVVYYQSRIEKLRALLEGGASA